MQPLTHKKVLWAAAAIAALFWASYFVQRKVLAACGCQLRLILLDPAPHLYVYGWSAIPAVIGFAAMGAAAAAYVGFASAAVFVVLAAAYVW